MKRFGNLYSIYYVTILNKTKKKNERRYHFYEVKEIKEV